VEDFKIIKKFAPEPWSKADAFLVEYGGRRLVCKKSRGAERGLVDPDFEESRLAEIQYREQLAGYAGNINIPKIVDSDVGLIMEEFVPGERADNALIKSLSPAQKDGIIKDMAEFLNFAHQATAVRERTVYKSVMFLAGNESDVASLYERHIEPKDLRRVKKVLRDARKLQLHIVENYSVFVHGDLHPANILYDKADEKLSLIDCGCARRQHHNEDMVHPDMVAHDAWCEILAAVIDLYNKLPKTHPIYYNKWRIWLLLEYMTYHMQAKLVSVGRYPEKLLRTVYYEKLRPKLRTLDAAFGIVSGRE
jgi:tRNA A-37 threonylcarbamoyl transferase component Bud32